MSVELPVLRDSLGKVDPVVLTGGIQQSTLSQYQEMDMDRAGGAVVLLTK